MQVLCMKGTVAQWHVNLNFPVEPQICSYMYIYRVKRNHCSMRWTQSKLLIWSTSYRFQVKVTIRCVYIVVFWGINLELTILKLMLNAVYCKIYKIMCLIYICLRKSSACFRKISAQTRKVVRFAMKKTQCFCFFLEKLDSEKNL